MKFTFTDLSRFDISLNLFLFFNFFFALALASSFLGIGVLPIEEFKPPVNEKVFLIKKLDNKLPYFTHLVLVKNIRVK